MKKQGAAIILCVSCIMLITSCGKQPIIMIDMTDIIVISLLVIALLFTVAFYVIQKLSDWIIARHKKKNGSN